MWKEFYTNWTIRKYLKIVLNGENTSKEFMKSIVVKRVLLEILEIHVKKFHKFKNHIKSIHNEMIDHKM